MSRVNEESIAPFNTFVITLDTQSAKEIAAESKEDPASLRWTRAENALRKRLKTAFPNANLFNIEVI